MKGIQSPLLEALQQKPKEEQAQLDTIKALLQGHSSYIECIDTAAQKCSEAQKKWSKMDWSNRRAVLEAMRGMTAQVIELLANAAHNETQRGVPEDKMAKLRLILARTPGLDDIKPRIVRGPDGTTIFDYDALGVIASTTPVTNPCATVVSNCLTALAGGNGLIFQPHPQAAHCTSLAVALLSDAAICAGMPEGLIASIANPSIAGANKLMTHEKVNVNLVTGGPGVVRAALSSGKRAICAGPGNPPVIVDETADIAEAARGIVKGASFDNNMVCSDEKEVFIVSSVFDEVSQLLARDDKVFLLDPKSLADLERTIFQPTTGSEKSLTREIKRHMAGIDAEKILGEMGIDSPHTVRLIVVQVDRDHPLVHTEQLMPVLPIVKVRDFEEALSEAERAENHRGHSAALYTKRIDRISAASLTLKVSNLAINGPTLVGLGDGGEGHTSFSIAGHTGEGYTTPMTFTKERRVTLSRLLRLV